MAARRRPNCAALNGASSLGGRRLRSAAMLWLLASDFALPATPGQLHLNAPQISPFLTKEGLPEEHPPEMRVRPSNGRILEGQSPFAKAFVCGGASGRDHRARQLEEGGWMALGRRRESRG